MGDGAKGDEGVVFRLLNLHPLSFGSKQFLIHHKKNNTVRTSPHRFRKLILSFQTPRRIYMNRDEKVSALAKIIEDSDRRDLIQTFVRTVVLSAISLIIFFAGSFHGHNLTIEMQRDREAIAIEKLTTIVQQSAHTK